MDRDWHAAVGAATILATDALLVVLRGAYSGELAAARAYHGHWRSLRDPDQRDEVRRIEEAELAHRRRIGEMLAELGSRPARWREIVFGTIGRVFGTLCHVSGWFLPMYMAGWLEAINVGQYQRAVEHAERAGLHHYVGDLAAMVTEEQRHERFFASMAGRHRLATIAGRLGPWDPRTLEPAPAGLAS